MFDRENKYLLSSNTIKIINLFLFGIASAMLFLAFSFGIEAVNQKRGVRKGKIEPKLILNQKKSDLPSVKKPVVVIKNAATNEKVITPRTVRTPVVKKQYVPAIKNCSLVTNIRPSIINLNLYKNGVTQVKEPINYFRVYGRDVNTIKRQIWSCGPNRYINKSHVYAISQSRLAMDYNLEKQGGACTPNNVRIVVKTKITMPIWSADGYTSQSIKNSMTRFINGLKVHENGHGQIDLQYANILYNRLNKISASDCDQVRSQIKATYQNTIRELGNVQHNYEIRTRYGARQGGWL